jgi:hypothetical protein
MTVGVTIKAIQPFSPVVVQGFPRWLPEVLELLTNMNWNPNNPHTKWRRSIENSTLHSIQRTIKLAYNRGRISAGNTLKTIFWTWYLGVTNRFFCGRPPVKVLLFDAESTDSLTFVRTKNCTWLRSNGFYLIFRDSSLWTTLLRNTPESTLFR